MSTSASFNREFRTETWTLYGVGVFLTMLRLVAQTRKLGINGLRADDWVVTTAILWYTLLVVSLNQVVFGGGSNYMTPEEIAGLTPETRLARTIASKWVLVSEEMMILSVWTCKLCMLFIYRRLTQGLHQMVIINVIFAYVAVGFVATQIALFAECRPFSGYWSVPAISDQCWSYYSFEIVVATFNISSDVAVLVIAIPLIINLHVPIQQKAILCIVFGMGFFVIAAAILTKVFSLDPNLVSYSYLNWYFREASVSLYVVNLPLLWALFRDIFPSARTWGYARTTGDSTRPSNNNNLMSSGTQSKNDVPLSNLESYTDEELDTYSAHHSEERIIPLYRSKKTNLNTTAECSHHSSG
ncbi:hypothetical protein BGW36DRAFT_386238 [Talaromyces proteolyticus]|uniref:Rhodopsin domain-containing protein n=1 Tax=Talaromyces proteolyticus TaxID=1131652 RepID=A0AAD4PTG9_9EURO|nr:uncharacterized protein BGW36DRAFT_386238 [Talaromyces proteolyticus]KAH8693270.1 hypothetical protein BGW36DRAFT_386238 [Talaromyces proteolyticus]